MSASNIKVIVNTLSAIAAIVAAILWYKASVVVVRPLEERDQDGMTTLQLTINHKSTGDIDPFLTNIEQSKWSKWASIAASIAALLQAVGLLIPETT